MKRIDPDEARELGFTVDDTTYPWIGYKGPRFKPAEVVECWTETEAALRAELAITESLLAERQRILDALPCPQHGTCVPYVLDFIENAKAK